MNKHDVLFKVAEYCNKNLLKNKKALNYLQKRKISLKSINNFSLGLFPKSLSELFENIDVDPKLLREYGVVRDAEKSQFLNNDLIFPIHDVYGELIALTGRTRLNSEQIKKTKQSKYWNMSYKKTQHLYGLYLAKDEIIKQNKVYVVEGNFDVISSHQHGIKNVVAVCSGSFSTRQAILLARYTENIVLWFDNDEEAQEKARVASEKKAMSGINIIVENPLPHGFNDIDEYLRTGSAAELFKSKKGLFNIKPFW